MKSWYSTTKDIRSMLLSYVLVLMLRYFSCSALSWQWQCTSLSVPNSTYYHERWVRVQLRPASSQGFKFIALNSSSFASFLCSIYCASVLLLRSLYLSLYYLCQLRQGMTEAVNEISRVIKSSIRIDNNDNHRE